MKKLMSKKVVAAVTAAAMTMSLAACGGAEPAAPAAPAEPAPAATETKEEAPKAEEVKEEAPVEEEEVSPYTVITDDSGNPVDLGGMEVIIRDWWSGDPADPTPGYQEAQKEYRDWAQETYNFKISQKAISDWGSTPADFVDYCTTGGDDVNYVWTLRDDPAITSAMAQGLMYDLSTLDCLDFSSDKFTANKLHEQYSKGGKIFAMYAGPSEPRTGVYFNKKVLQDAGIDPESLYDMQADGTWTWDKFDELMGKCQRDTDNDGADDVFGLTVNEGNMTTAAIFSNGGSYIGKDSNGYTYNLESAETLEALEWTVEMFTKYDQHDPEGAEWDYYKEEFLNGSVAFMVDDEYCGCPGNFLDDMKDPVGFVMFPKGPKGKDYINVWSNNPCAIPACYDADRAWKIAFAWNQYTMDPPGYEGSIDALIENASNGKLGEDDRALEETIPMMTEPAHGTIAFHGMIPDLNLGPDFVWGIGPNSVVSEAVEAIRDTWKSYVDAANK
ncbi:MAG: extracellular solute-binding protein [Lachnospiraceae bacterium]|nr:extracellular solute-binding protein [Lachnospiraceae bacterium]